MKKHNDQHRLANRARRIPRRIRQIQSEIKSHDQRCAAIENDETVSQETRQAAIKRIRERCGPLNYQLRMLQSRLSEIPDSFRDKLKKIVSSEWNGVPRLSASDNFPESDLGRRVGKCVRAFNTVQQAYRA